jgi:2-methylaconitate cis-trans-isomerase PrpF
MTQTAIPYVFMRGGTSRGPYFNRADLPKDLETLAEVLISVVGSGHPLNIDGIGGGAAVTTKVAMLSPAADDWADIDYFFAQVSVEDRKVDFKPTCGNILCGVASAAIEMGLVPAQEGKTEIRINAVNTGARVLSTVETSGGAVRYDGETAIDGVPGTATPVGVSFMDVAGSATGKLLPTGNATDIIEGIKVTCIDVAMPLVIARADAFGKTGYETAAELDEDSAFMDHMLAVRLAAGAAMGMGDVTDSVTPKFAILSEPREDGAITARYFMPWKCHPTMAVTGAQCIASCALMSGTVAEGLVRKPNDNPARVIIEHPSGSIEVLVDYAPEPFEIRSAGLTRTCRKLAAGEVFVPRAVWDGR